MQFDIPIAEQQRLAERAAAHGFDDVNEFVVKLLTNVASLSDEAAVFAPLTEEQRTASEELIRRGEEDLNAGRVRDMREGLRELGAQRGLTPDA